MNDNYLGTAAFAAVVLYLCHVFVSAAVLLYIFSSIAAILLFFSLFKMNRINRTVVLVLLLTGSSLFYFYETTFAKIWMSFGENMNLLALFLLIPFLGILMSESGYLQALQAFFLEREKRRASHPYRMGFFLTASMGSILNLGSMPLVYNIGYESFSSFENKRFVMMLLRAFGFCMLWSPYFINVGLILSLYNLSWIQIGIPGLALATIYALFIPLFFRKTIFAGEYKIINQQPSVHDIKTVKHRLFMLAAFVLVLLILSFAVESVFSISMLASVSIIALFLPLLWSAVTGNSRVYIQSALQHVQGSFGRLYNEVGIFITAGFFGEALSISGAGEWLSTMMMKGSGGIIPLLILMLIATAVALAFVGIHPVIIVLGFGSSLQPAHFGVEPAFMGLMLLTAWMMAVQLSPFSGSVLMASNLMRESPWSVIRKNVPFIALMALVMTTVLSFMEWFGLL
ncbi:TRAP transporter large permease subunit [Salibacterium halotolerans]|uniref:Tripartite ATP-independent transporter, DctM component n=1 Tax=Salibacterium halotolerans TaxID=1884432 RepID=A0A1I5QCT7_9BACI|nr:TRAP transporter large permease subunit [Salibacterium halotolerans]SFP44109.1 Tripartite ATP-independent transporter, DctM component [Salibacterium halotolerans]